MFACISDSSFYYDRVSFWEIYHFLLSCLFQNTFRFFVFNWYRLGIGIDAEWSCTEGLQATQTVRASNEDLERNETLRGYFVSSVDSENVSTLVGGLPSSFPSCIKLIDLSILFQFPILANLGFTTSSLVPLCGWPSCRFTSALY